MPIIKPAVVSPAAPQQHKQPSRKGKKAWRKNVDVTEIQEGLETVRDELTKGYVVHDFN
jgi:nucleolar protein 53